MYNQHRDLVWRWKSFLRNIKNSKDVPFFVEECLAPSDQKLKAEASRMNLSKLTRDEEVCVFNKNSSISSAVKVKEVVDLDALKKTYVPKITHEPPSYPPAIRAAQLNHQMVSDKYIFSKEPESFVVDGTPLLPTLLKGPTPAVKKPLSLSPFLESENLAKLIFKELLPAVVEAIQPAKKARASSMASDGGDQSEIDPTAVG